ARVHGARGQLYFQRQSLWALGAEAEAWLTELIHRRPARWRPDVETCFTLLQDYGPAAMLAAFAWGARPGAIGAEHIRTPPATPRGPRPGVRDRRPLARLQRPEWHREDAPGRRHRLSRHPEWLRRRLHHRDGAHRRIVPRIASGGDARRRLALYTLRRARD